MIVELEIPDRIPARFDRPSWELLRFIEGLIKFSILLAEYKTANGFPIFTAFIRNGATTVFSTTTGQTHFIEERYSDLDDPEDIPLPENGEVYMDEDEPGKWVVARFCDPYLNLYSTDFIGPEPSAINILKKCITHVMAQAHTVPEQDSKIQKVLECLRAI